MKATSFLIVGLLSVCLSGCGIIRMFAEGKEFYERGYEAGQLDNTQIAATVRAKALTDIPLTQQAQTATAIATSTLAPAETPEPTETPAPPPTPKPLFFVRTKGKENTWYKTYNNSGFAGGGTQGQSGQYFPGTSIWDGQVWAIPTPAPAGSDQGSVALGVLGSYLPLEQRQTFPVVGTASGDFYCQVSLETWMEISDLSPDLRTTVGVRHPWRHPQPMIHAHFWAEPRTDDYDLVIGFLDPGNPVTPLEVSPSGLMVKVRTPDFWMECAVLERLN